MQRVVFAESISSDSGAPLGSSAMADFVGLSKEQLVELLTKTNSENENLKGEINLLKSQLSTVIQQNTEINAKLAQLMEMSLAAQSGDNDIRARSSDNTKPSEKMNATIYERTNKRKNAAATKNPTEKRSKHQTQTAAFDGISIKNYFQPLENDDDVVLDNSEND